MDNTKSEIPEIPESGLESKPGDQLESQTESQPVVEAELTGFVNKKITKAYDRGKMWFAQGKDRYRNSPRLQKVVYQGKFMPAFWTVTAIFSLIINVIFIALLVFFGHLFFDLKSLIADDLVTELSNNLELMDQAHIVDTVTVETTVRLQDNLPVEFNLPINQTTQLALTEDIRIPGAYIYLNNTAVQTDLTLPAGTPIQASLDMTIPVSQSVPVDVTGSVSLLVPLDLAIDQTDLHQSILGIQDAIDPYKVLLGSEFTSTKDFPICNQWWTGWLCRFIFGQP
jgi:hypothetical protein